MNTSQVAQHKWRGILTSFGIDEAFLTGKHGACPMCGGKDRFRFLDYEGKGTWVCNQCQPKPADGFDLLMQFSGQSFADLAKEIDSIIGNVSVDTPLKKKDPKVRLNHLAQMSRPLNGNDPASRYLKSRGITVKPYNVRYAESYGYFSDDGFKGRYPVMIARVQTAAGERITFHITYLTKAGQKASVDTPKKILPPDGTINGCGIYLGPVSRHMIIGEGIETALAGQQTYNAPAIAAISAGGMERIQIPDQVKEITILADADENYTGQKAAYALANRLAVHGRYVEVVIPKKLGTDFADELLGAA